jgi:hypothetical protein
MGMTEGIPVEVKFQDEDPERVLALLDEISAADVEQVNQSGFTGLEFILAAFILKGLSSLIIGVVHDWKSGVIVDAREKTIVTQKSADLPRGDVLIIGPGDVKWELHEPKQTEIDAIVKKLIPFLNH